MRIMYYGHDGGPKSTVWGAWLIELKRLFSIVLLRFEGQSGRDAYHEHAFHCISWVIHGELREEFLDGRVKIRRPSFVPFITSRSDFHRVHSKGRSFALSFRGPWTRSWREYLPSEQRYVVLTNGRQEIIFY
jgi:hypothetical protein